MEEKMQAVRFHEYGDSKTLVRESVPRPAPNANEVLVKVSFAGVNPVDWKLRSGMYKAFMPVTFPSIPGREFSGVVEAVGPGVTQFSKGQKVFGPGNGTYSEYVVVPAADIAAVPAGMSLEEAAATPLGALTAWHVVEDSSPKSGQTVVVIGAAGGVGLFATQFARIRGAKVIGVASTENQEFVKSLGAEPVDYKAGPVASKIKDADIVIDTVGGKALEEAYSLLRKGGALFSVAGQVSEEKAKQLGIRASSSGNRGAAPLGKIVELISEGKVVTEVAKVFPLADAPAAHDLSQTGHGRGRILLKV